jgi:hypothetical protein
MPNPKHKSKPHVKRFAMQRRNAGPPAPRAPRKPPEAAAEKASVGALLPAAGGAASVAAVGTLLAHEGWKPKTIATGLAALGALLAWRGRTEAEREVGLGAAGAALGQLLLLLWPTESEHSTAVATNENKPRQAEALPPGALESAFERARRRLALDADEAERFGRVG